MGNDHHSHNPTPNHLCQLLCWRSVRAGYAGGGDMSDYAELKRLAEAATPGPWVKTVDGVMPEGEKFGIFGNFGATNGESNREFIAAANPAVVLALLAERDHFKAENEQLKHEVSAGGAREWDMRSQVKAAKESRARVVASNKALRKDSKRYRWFRDCGSGWNDTMVLDSHGRLICEELDERIDSAMSKEP
jgi:hypothetical protein